MPRDRFEDETLSDPLKLLARYRDLCERVGGFRSSHEPIPRAIQQQISEVEAELQTRLWLAGRSANSEQRTASSAIGLGDVGTRGRGAGSAAVSAAPPWSAGVSPVPGLPLPLGEGRGEDAPHPPTPNTQHPTPSTQLNGIAEVYSDGSCLGNPGPGGYGTIVRFAGKPEKVLSAGKARTTNNEMELTGAIEGLKTATAMGASEITVVSDSEYLVKGMNGWIKGWLRNGWKTRTGDPVKNKALWEELYRLTQGKAVTWKWVAGHSGHPENERCNALAVAAAQRAATTR